jgi:steroid 5-alpha reductase family enzyme
MPYTLKRETIEIVVVAIAFLIAIPIVFLILPKKGDVIRIDCTWSEISPDFTIEMREACRQLRAKNNLQKPK